MSNLLTPAQFRGFVNTPLEDPGLQLLLDAAESSIVARVGVLGALEDRRRGGGEYVYTSRRAASMTQVIERYGDVLGLTDVTLDPTDYTLLPDGYTVRREWNGVHRNDRWADNAPNASQGSVILRYPAFDDTVERQRVAIALVKLDLNYNPALAGQSIGAWSESYSMMGGTRGGTYVDEREAILDSLGQNVAWFA